MTFVRRSSRIALSLAIAAVTLVATSACEVYDGDLPPRGALQTPNGLAVHPSGRYLYVLNSNFQSLYRQDLGGTLTVVDLDTLAILDEKTLCLPSFGSTLAFSSSHFAADEPRFLVAATKSNRGVVALALNEQGDTVSCLYEGMNVGDTCVSEITSIPGVSKRHRILPCEVRNILDDPGGLVALPPIENVTPMNQDAFVLSGLRTGETRAINFVDGEIRGQDVKGPQQNVLHLSEDDTKVASGAATLVTHPLTGDIYVGARFDNRIFSIRWLREPITATIDPERRGFATTIARTGGVRVTSPSSSLEIRDMKFSADGSRLYATSQAPGSLITMDTSLDAEGKPRNVVIRRDELPGRPSAMALLETDDTTYAYVTLFGERAVAAIDLSTGLRVATIAVGSTPYAIVADPTRARVYVALFEENAVAVIDGDESRPTWNQQIATIR